MPISESERQRVIAVLDSMEEVVARAIIATMESFAAWLARELPTIFQRIRDRLAQLWDSVRSVFR